MSVDKTVGDGLRGVANLEKIAQFIFLKEARWDGDGNLVVYYLPEEDKGGTFEVAGISDFFHPHEAGELLSLLQAGKEQDAVCYAVEFIKGYVASAMMLHEDIRVSLFMADLAFNRGVVGAMKIAQHAMKVAGIYKSAIDGIWGRQSDACFNRIAAEELVPRLLLSWHWYERTKMKRDEGNRLWPGLVQRRVDALQLALGLGDPLKSLV